MSFGAYQRIGLGIVLVALFWCARTESKALAQEGPKKTRNSDDSSLGYIRERRLTNQQTRNLATDLRLFAVQKFWIISETGIDAPESEQMKFAQQLKAVLLSAGWIEAQMVPLRMGPAGFKQTKMQSYSRGGDNGVVLFVPRDSIGAGRCLNRVLNGISIRSSIEPDDNVRHVILVLVGDN